MAESEPRFVHPRRFAEVWQISEDWPGTLDQQRSVRAGLDFPFKSPGHLLMQRIDRHVNAADRSYLPIGFLEMDQLDLSGAGGINLSHHLKDPVIIRTWLLHGIGHVLDQRDMITQQDRWQFMDWISGHHNGNWNREYQETFADAVRDWLLWHGVGLWARLTPILLPA